MVVKFSIYLNRRVFVMIHLKMFLYFLFFYNTSCTRKNTKAQQKTSKAIVNYTIYTDLAVL